MRVQMRQGRVFGVFVQGDCCEDVLVSIIATVGVGVVVHVAAYGVDGQIELVVTGHFQQVIHGVE